MRPTLSAVAVSLAAILAVSSAAPVRAQASRAGVHTTAATPESPPGDGLARGAGDALVLATVAGVQVVDALLVPALEGDLALAWKASLAHATSLALTLGVARILDLAVGRAQLSESSELHAVMPSDLAFASAGFSCAMHVSRGLYGDRGADLASCGASVALATAAGALRAASDPRELPDVLVGAAVGLVLGYVIPLAIVPARPPPGAVPGDRRAERERDAREQADDDALLGRTEQGFRWSALPMLSTPRAELARPIDGSAIDGSAAPGIGPMTGGATGGGGGLGSTFGVSVSGTF